MNLTKASSIAEIVSSIAILATLIYLAIQTQQVATQTQQNTIALNAETRTALFQMHQNVMDNALQNPEILVSLNQAEPLSLEQKIKLSTWAFQFVGQREFMWIQTQEGIVDERTLETLFSDVDGLLIYPRLLNWWRFVSDFYFDQGFVEAVDSRIENGLLESAPDYLSLLNDWQ